ncbi:hypothetical protein FHX42_002347 [Saccharopolyspora lacisalsi]|uniref:DUF1990 domain-containing protein n=1 Tax=Halosaccharopolyspora lacisalsi TaxID=1000566 RepID=A0A839DVR9_9PSEU|nr:DUF1990 family protein [Halosaccharopolyspora lacisalsi]MBA8825000.1 hypothetical protein [Halosaccharopolyspora lacisalsi]
MNDTADAGFARVDTERLLNDLHDRDVNYRPDEVDARQWNFDIHRVALPRERPGPPEEGGVWRAAAELIGDYEFSAPGLVRAVYDPGEPLPGRHMLLEGRFAALRFYFGVRVTSVTDETRERGRRAWGWSYETLQGHLERGRISYEVVKHQDTGHVEFVISAHSQLAPTVGPILRLGWVLFGRRRQLSFHRSCGRRVNRLVRSRRGRPEAAAPKRDRGLVLAPSDARVRALDRVAPHRVDPGLPPTSGR